MTADVPPIGAVPPEVGATSSHSAAAGPSASAEDIHVSSMEDLRQKAPEVYKMLMENFVMKAISDQRRAVERFREAQRKMRE